MPRSTVSGLPRPCLVCGTPTLGSGRCPAHQLPARPRPSAARRGYDAKWRRLAAKARALWTYCAQCGTTEDLTVDHLRWPANTLDDVQVLCRSCNSRKGAAPGRGVEPKQALRDLASPSKSPTLSPPDDGPVIA